VTDISFRDNATRVAAHIAAEDGTSRVLTVVEYSLLRT
jgi:hypothetical protein